MTTGTDEFLPTRKSLLTRLKNWDDQEGWREFFEMYWRLIYSVALKAGFNDAEAQDIVQDTILAVAKKMRGFKYDPQVGSFKSWLLLNVRSRIAEHLRKRNRGIAAVTTSANDETWINSVENLPDPAAANIDAFWDEEWERNLLAAALERVKSEVSAKQFLMFDLYVLKQTPMSKITRSLGVNAAQVYMAKYRLSRLLQSELKRLERGLH
jgi:RNA polymerase sigma-70 factor (ECF subfamily)